MPGGSKKGGGLKTKKSPFYKMKGFSGFGNESPIKQSTTRDLSDTTQEKSEKFREEIKGKGGTRGTGKTYEERWSEMSTKEKDKFGGSLKFFKTKAEAYHHKKDYKAHIKEGGKTPW